MHLPPLSNETIWAILKEEIADRTVNELVWHCLGYRYENEQWDTSAVAPDFIESRPATVKLTRSIAPEYKQLLKEELGFTGYKIGEFGPRQTRRATMANWLLGFRKLTTQSGSN
jgi:hypothetical protein